MNILEAAVKAANDKQVKESAEGMYSLYRALQDAGFDKQEAMMLMMSMIPNGKKAE